MNGRNEECMCSFGLSIPEKYFLEKPGHTCLLIYFCIINDIESSADCSVPTEMSVNGSGRDPTIPVFVSGD
jgi:hypothetical protein